MNIYDLVIVGSGPAGVTAAIYGQRMGLKTLIVEKGAPGGRLLNTHSIGNYPGFENISGGDLSMKLFNQATKLGAEYKFGEVTKIKDEYEKIKTVVVGEEEVKAKTIFISAGMSPMMLKIPRVDDFYGKGGLGICVICDAAFHKGKPIALIGGGNSATEESLFAQSIASKVYLINKFSSLKAEKITLERIKKTEKIEVMNNTEVIELLGDEKLSGIMVKNNQTNEVSKIELSGVFVYIGNLPNTSFIRGLDILDDNNFIQVNYKFETKIPGIFAGGDVIEKHFRQITTSVSDGTEAALWAAKYIEMLD